MSVSLRRQISLLVVFLLALGCIAGCGSAASTEGSAGSEKPEVSANTENSANSESSGETVIDETWDDEPIEIIFWYTYAEDSAERTKFLDEIMPMWSELHPNVTVNAVPKVSGEEYHIETIAAIATASAPDVARIENVYPATYAELGALVQLDTFSDFAALKETFLEAPLSSNFYNGGYYGMPLDTNCKAAVVNTDVMKAMGIADGIPDTMEELIAAAGPYAQSSGKKAMYVTGVGDWDFNPYFWLFGGVLTNDEFTQASGYLDSDASVQAMETLRDLNQKEILGIFEVDGSLDAWGNQGISAGNYAMFFEGPWYFGAYDENQNPIIVPALIPTYNDQTASVVGGNDIVVFSGSQHPQAAYEFAKFMCSEEVQATLLEGAGIIPSVKAVAESETVTSHPVLSVYMEQIKSAKTRIPSPKHSEIFEAWKNAMNKILLNGEDIKTTLTEAAIKIDGFLKVE